MVQALERRWPKSSEHTSAATETVGAPVGTFSVDNELLTSEKVLVQTRQRGSMEREQRWTRRSEPSGSYTMISGQIIAFPSFSESSIGITEGELEEEVSDEFHYRDIVVKSSRRVIFSKEISLDSGNMRRLQPKIILDERYLSRDDD
ncbi:MAG TPA: hypothetical protein V6D17_09905 [Candidatus Obscuribacterales bacterium]